MVECWARVLIGRDSVVKNVSQIRLKHALMVAVHKNENTFIDTPYVTVLRYLNDNCRSYITNLYTLVPSPYLDNMKTRCFIICRRRRLSGALHRKRFVDIVKSLAIIDTKRVCHRDWTKRTFPDTYRRTPVKWLARYKSEIG